MTLNMTELDLSTNHIKFSHGYTDYQYMVKSAAVPQKKDKPPANMSTAMHIFTPNQSF